MYYATIVGKPERINSLFSYEKSNISKRYWKAHLTRAETKTLIKDIMYLLKRGMETDEENTMMRIMKRVLLSNYLNERIEIR